MIDRSARERRLDYIRDLAKLVFESRPEDDDARFFILLVLEKSRPRDDAESFISRTD